MTKAEQVGVPILDEAAFERLLETGELLSCRPATRQRQIDVERPGVGAGGALALDGPPVDDRDGVRARRRSARSAPSSPGVNVSVPLPGSNTTPGGTSTCSPGSTSTDAELVEADRRQRDVVDDSRPS